MAKQPSSPDQPPLQVAIADKSPLIQAALNHLISEDPRFQLQAVCGDGEELLEIIEATDLDVVVTGWVMPPGDGRYVLDHLKATESAPRVVVYTGAEGEMVPSLVMAMAAPRSSPKANSRTTFSIPSPMSARAKWCFRFWM